MLARVTNWLVASHPELHPRENQPVFGRLPNNVAGHTDKGFLSSTITIDPAKNLTDAAYVDTFSHELLHVQDSWWKEFVIGLFPGPEQNDWFGFHQAIYDQGTAITIQFDEQIAGGR